MMPPVEGGGPPPRTRAHGQPAEVDNPVNTDAQDMVLDAVAADVVAEERQTRRYMWHRQLAVKLVVVAVAVSTSSRGGDGNDGAPHVKLPQERRRGGEDTAS